MPIAARGANARRASDALGNGPMIPAAPVSGPVKPSFIYGFFAQLFYIFTAVERGQVTRLAPIARNGRCGGRHRPPRTLSPPKAIAW